MPGYVKPPVNGRMVGASEMVPSIHSQTPLTIKGAVSQTANLLNIQNSAGTSLISVDSSGISTSSQQPAFNAWINLSSATAGTFPFNATVFNIGNYFNTSNYRFNAPSAGIYLFGATIADDTAGEFTGKIVSFYKNGLVYRDIIEGVITQNSHWETHGGTLINLQAGDYVDVRMRSGSVNLEAGTDGYFYRNSFYGQKVS
jgi:hypothetical protein